MRIARTLLLALVTTTLAHAAGGPPVAVPPPPPAGRSPVSAEIRYNDGEAFAHRQQWTRAEGAYREATALRADFPEAWNGIGHALKMQRRYPDALQAYQRALTLRPDYPQALEYLGETYVAMGRLDDARGTLARLKPLDGNLGERLERAIDEGKPGGGW
jgi:tetratricopeptide (TPR) repeat protein